MKKLKEKKVRITKHYVDSSVFAVLARIQYI